MSNLEIFKKTEDINKKCHELNGIINNMLYYRIFRRSFVKNIIANIITDTKELKKMYNHNMDRNMKEHIYISMLRSSYILNKFKWAC